MPQQVFRDQLGIFLLFLFTIFIYSVDFYYGVPGVNEFYEGTCTNKIPRFAICKLMLIVKWDQPKVSL